MSFLLYLEHNLKIMIKKFLELKKIPLNSYRYFINSYYFSKFFMFVRLFIKFIFKNIKGYYRLKWYKIEISLKGHSYHFFALKKQFSQV